MDKELKKEIILDLLNNIPKKYRHNQHIQHRKEFFLFRINLAPHLELINVYVSESKKQGFYDVEFNYYQSKPYITSVDLKYTVRGVSSLVKNNLTLLIKQNEK